MKTSTKSCFLFVSDGLEFKFPKKSSSSRVGEEQVMIPLTEVTILLPELIQGYNSLYYFFFLHLVKKCNANWLEFSISKKRRITGWLSKLLFLFFPYLSLCRLLQKLELPILSSQQCRTRFPLFSDIHPDKHLCAGGEVGESSLDWATSRMMQHLIVLFTDC